MNTLAHRRRSGGGGLLRVILWLAVLVVLAWLATFALGRGGGDAAATLPMPTDAQIKQGEYLARLGDCAACHTAPGGKAFAGGLPIASPIGTLFSTNITPDPKTGIGNYTYGQFERAVRRGIKPSGQSMYPAMPFPSFSRVSDQDVQALYAYFMRGVTPVEQDNLHNRIHWPLSMRWPLTYWRWLFAPKVEPMQVAMSQHPVLARGEYLVEGLGHCGACHTPRAFTLQERSLGNSPLFLSGGESDNWIAPSLRGELASGLGSVSEAELVTVLKSGRSERSAIFGSMYDVVEHSTQFMSDDDLTAIATFLKSLTPSRQEAPVTYDQATRDALFAGKVNAPGAQLYIDNCATCHRTDGHGYGYVYPALAGNPIANGDDPRSIIRLVLHGGTMPSGRDAPSQFSMPAFRDRLTDHEVAEILTFVRSSWGNRGGSVDAQLVAHMRHLPPAGEPMMTGYDPRAGQPAAGAAAQH